MGVDLTKNFYFSYTYCLAATLQSNYMAGVAACASQQQQHPQQGGSNVRERAGECGDKARLQVGTGGCGSF